MSSRIHITLLPHQHLLDPPARRPRPRRRRRADPRAPLTDITLQPTPRTPTPIYPVGNEPPNTLPAGPGG